MFLKYDNGNCSVNVSALISHPRYQSSDAIVQTLFHSLEVLASYPVKQKAALIENNTCVPCRAFMCALAGWKLKENKLDWNPKGVTAWPYYLCDWMSSWDQGLRGNWSFTVEVKFWQAILNGKPDKSDMHW